MIPESITVAGSLIASAKAALDIAKTVKDLAGGDKATDFKERSIALAELVIPLQEKLLTYIDMANVLVTENAALREETAKLKKHRHDFEQYHLKEIARGVFVYQHEHSMNPAAPPHSLCATCYNNGIKSILQLKGEALSGDIYQCHVCNSEICDHSKKRDPGPAIVSVKRSSINWNGY